MQKIRKLLIDTTELTGIATPTLATRYYFIHEWADAAGLFVQLAIVARPEIIDTQKFGVTVAQNRGFNANVFVTREAAHAWLETH